MGDSFLVIHSWHSTRVFVRNLVSLRSVEKLRALYLKIAEYFRVNLGFHDPEDSYLEHHSVCERSITEEECTHSVSVGGVLQ